MRNSQVKLSRNTVANPFQNSNYYNQVTTPKVGDLKSSRAFITRYGTFESNYNYFVKRIGEQKINEEIANNGFKKNHQRYNSMGNSRLILQSAKTSQYKGSKINSCQSSPYLLPRPTTANDDRLKILQTDSGSMTTNFSKHSMKFSMKNLPSNRKQELKQKNCSQESISSTVHETNYTSIISKSVSQQLAKQELYKYFSTIYQKFANNLKAQIDQQNQFIISLQIQIKNLTTQLFSKQQRITQLITILKNNKYQNKVELNPQNQSPQKICMKKVKQIEDYLNNSLKYLTNQQSQAQRRLNEKIDQISQKIINLPFKRANTYNQTLKEDLMKIYENIRRYNQILQSNVISIRFLQQIKRANGNIKQKCDGINKSLGSITMLEQTAQFKILQSHMKKEQLVEQMNDSMSYFFHPAQFANLQKITQLFINRQGQPIKCYTDKFNQVKYKDTNTYMFNKKGDIVQLTSKEKQYYIDKGYIIH